MLCAQEEEHKARVAELERQVEQQQLELHLLKQDTEEEGMAHVSPRPSEGGDAWRSACAAPTQPFSQ